MGCTNATESDTEDIVLEPWIILLNQQIKSWYRWKILSKLLSGNLKDKNYIGTLINRKDVEIFLEVFLQDI